MSSIILFDGNMSQPEENVTKKFIDRLAVSLKENKFKEALDLFEDRSYDDIIKETSWEIVQIASSYLTKENAKHNGKAIECCTMILDAIAEKCNSCETVLEFLEQVDSSEDDTKFCIILRVLGKSLSKMNDKSKAIEWCVSTISSYVESLPVPEVDSQDITIIKNKIKNVYDTIIRFLEPLIDEVALENDNSQNNTVLRNYLACILIFLMGKPLCYLPEKPKSDSEQHLPEKIITLLSRIKGDLLWFLNVVNNRSKRSCSKNKNIYKESCNLEVLLFELNENISDLAYANLYFHTITELQLWKKVPHVYDSQYIFQSCIYLIIKLVQEQQNVTIRKGLHLMGHLLRKITRYSLTSQLLELNVYSDVLDSLVKVMMYCDSDEERSKALHVFQKYIEMFNMEGRYLIILHLYQISEHSGLLSVTTGMLKECIIECLETTPPTTYFLGNNLECLLKFVCKLPHGSASDMVELSDEIITSLNLLRFLFLRDVNNQTGIWNLVDKLENEYLKPLREGISLCRAHWKVKMKDLEEQKKALKTSDNIIPEKNEAEVRLTVGGKELPAMPISQKITFCYHALNGLDVMESILIRVNECISNNLFKEHNDNIVTSK
ncbi:glomulin-like isoform X1 [Hylaeus anthracinus]|uniref:glomulin-like isoform X1 n=1 Tax=Hylaeus anthracinus TaxID=313031 RepID=UPI0023B8AF59|nr:glomulin-like isoform X1 [Hylaeus anthracinus]XP_054012407.1 glomulin-like isoform X1 [Hylaeus anthracinus]